MTRTSRDRAIKPYLEMVTKLVTVAKEKAQPFPVSLR
jgi:hypothetical protein